MNKLLAVLTALSLWAGTASAERVLFIRTLQPGSSVGERTMALDEANWRQALDIMGCDYSVISQVGLTRFGLQSATESMRTGVVPRGGPGSGSDTYGMMVHQAYTRGSGTPARATGYNPDSLTIAGGWANIPHIFGTPFRWFNSDNYRSVASGAGACSTGLKTGQSFSFTEFVGTGLSARLVGTGLTWDAPGSGHLYYRFDAGAFVLDRTDPMILRARVIVGRNAVSFNTNGTTSSAYPDSMVNPTSQSSSEADTAQLYTRERRYTTGHDPAPLIYMPFGYSNGATITNDIAEKCMAIAIADSARGGTIIGQRVGWQPLKLAVLLSGAFTHYNSATNPNYWESHGAVVARDSAAIKAGVDSLVSLGLPIAVGVNIDSVETYANEKAWWFGSSGTGRAGWTYTPESYTLAKSNCATGNINAYTSNTLAADPYGLCRSRQLITADRMANGTACDGVDTTLSCIVQYMRDRLSRYGLPMSNTAVATYGNYIPENFKRNNLPPQDSLIMALWRSGYTGAVQGTMNFEANSSQSMGVDGAGGYWYPQGSFAFGNPYGYSYVQRSYTLYAPNSAGQTSGPRSGSTMVLGRFRWLSTREIDESRALGAATFHPMANEWVNSWGGGPWYYPVLRYNFYYHGFITRTSVITLKPADLGYTSSASSNMTRTGYHWLRRYSNRIKAINSLRWQAGPAPIQFVNLDDVQP